MNKYAITADVKFTIHWITPAKDPSEVILRDMAQLRLDEKVFAISKGFEKLLEITTMPEQLNE